jgi:hypothetical protein
MTSPNENLVVDILLVSIGLGLIVSFILLTYNVGHKLLT